MRMKLACGVAMVIAIAAGARAPHAQAPKRLALVGGRAFARTSGAEHGNRSRQHEKTDVVETHR